jgi:5'-nucleotidase
MAAVADVTIVAPASNQSGTSHSLTARGPIAATRVERPDGIPCHALEARPAVVLRWGLQEAAASPPDLVLSGINHGLNLGVATFASGTVAAAREAAIAGRPAVAVSADGSSPSDLAAAARIVRAIVERLAATGRIAPGLLLNVNVPRGAAAGVKGLRVTRQSLVQHGLAFERNDADVASWRMVARDAPAPQEGTDEHAVSAGWVSVTPLTFDQTVAGTAARRDLERALAGIAGAVPAPTGTR